MNNIESAVVAKLLATSAVTAVTGQRIYTRMAPQRDTNGELSKPYIVVTKVPNEQKQHKSGGSAGVTISYVAVTAWGDNYKSAFDTASLADAALDAQRATFGTVHCSFCLRQDGYDQSQLPQVDDELGSPGYRLIYKICHQS